MHISNACISRGNNLVMKCGYFFIKKTSQRASKKSFQVCDNNNDNGSQKRTEP